MTAAGFCGLKPLLFRRKSSILEGLKGYSSPKKSSKASKQGNGDPLELSFVGADRLILMVEIHKKIIAFRDVMDLAPCNSSASLREIVMKTLDDLQKLYPGLISRKALSKMKDKSIDQAMAFFCEALKSLGESWMMHNDWMSKLNIVIPSCKDKSNMNDLGGTMLTTLDCLMKLANERFDNMEEEDQKKESSPLSRCSSSSLGKFARRSSSFTDSIFSGSSSPVTPRSVLPEMMKHSMRSGESPRSSASSPLLLSLRVQAVGKLNPIDVRRLSFHMSPSRMENQRSKTEEEQPNRELEEDDKARTPAKDSSEDLVFDLDTTEESDIVTHDHKKTVTNEHKKTVEPETMGELGLTLSPRSPKPQSPKPQSPKPQSPKPQSPRPQSPRSPKPQSPRSPKPAETPALLQQAQVLVPQPPPLPPTMSLSKTIPQPPPPPPPPPPTTKIIMPKKAPPPPQLPPKLQVAEVSMPPTLPPPTPPPSPIGSRSAAALAPPPPPPMPLKDGSAPAPPPPMPCGKGGVPPPPPPAGRSFRAKATTKLKRSTHLGNLYRNLQRKVEGRGVNVKSSSGNGKKGGIGGGSTGGKQGMADALAEMTKRSSYFQQIEEDVQKYTKQITELRSAITNFKTKDMTELAKFHKNIESVLEKLTDESQVLARFEGFPVKKLEALRMATALYNKLNSILTELQDWNVATTFGKFLDKVERYFNKIKTDLDALERTKDEESKKLKAHNIEFDFNILIKIKEAVVDLSSNCMELALKEKRENPANSKGATQECAKLLWRAFQFAFRVYTFAGGLDDRADKLTRELAHEIEKARPEPFMK